MQLVLLFCQPLYESLFKNFDFIIHVFTYLNFLLIIVYCPILSIVSIVIIIAYYFFWCLYLFVVLFSVDEFSFLVALTYYLMLLFIQY